MVCASGCLYNWNIGGNRLTNNITDRVNSFTSCITLAEYVGKVDSIKERANSWPVCVVKMIWQDDIRITIWNIANSFKIYYRVITRAKWNGNVSNKNKVWIVTHDQTTSRCRRESGSSRLQNKLIKGMFEEKFMENNSTRNGVAQTRINVWLVYWWNIEISTDNYSRISYMQ